jgi:hypothetical protein
MPAMVFDAGRQYPENLGRLWLIPHWPKSEHALWVDEGGNV